jgi:hypothetical protein
MADCRFPIVDLLTNPLPSNEGEDCERIGGQSAAAYQKSEMA